MVSSSNINPNNSVEVVQPPTDAISSLSFSPMGNYLVATSWDNQVRCWEIRKQRNNTMSAARTSMSHEQPVLCSTWKDDGTTVFSGGCDNQVKMWPLMSGGQAQTIGMHDAPVKEVAWIPQMNVLVTGSWDKTLKYWDVRQPNPVHTQQLPDRCYALSVRHPLMVVATADRNLVVFNLQNPQAEFKRITSPLKYQTRCVAAFPDQQGFLMGSIEGRVGVHHLDDAQQTKNFTFKCHREGNDIYSVNAVNFHPTHGTIATSGSDGGFNFWDKDSKQKLKAMLRCNQPIPCSTFNNDGSIFAVRAYVRASPSLRCWCLMTGARAQKIIIHQLQEITYTFTYHRKVRSRRNPGSAVEENEHLTWNLWKSRRFALSQF